MTRQPVDMSPHAIAERMRTLSQLWRLGMKLRSVRRRDRTGLDDGIRVARILHGARNLAEKLDRDAGDED